MCTCSHSGWKLIITTQAPLPGLKVPKTKFHTVVKSSGQPGKPVTLVQQFCVGPTAAGPALAPPPAKTGPVDVARAMKVTHENPCYAPSA